MRHGGRRDTADSCEAASRQGTSRSWTAVSLDPECKSNPRCLQAFSACNRHSAWIFSLLLACLKVILPPVHPYPVGSVRAACDNQEHAPSHDLHSMIRCSEGANPVLYSGPAATCPALWTKIGCECQAV